LTVDLPGDTVMGMLLRELSLVAVDFETTGSVPGYPDEPWQIGLVPVVAGKPVFERAFDAYLHISPERPFSPFAPGSWRRVRDELARSAKLADLLPELRNKVLGFPLIAHNAGTEKKMFRRAWPLHQTGPWIDTLKLARRAYPGLDAYDLESVSRAAGVTPELALRFPDRAPHDALYDAAASAQVFCHLLGQPGWNEIELAEVI